MSDEPKGKSLEALRHWHFAIGLSRRVFARSEALRLRALIALIVSLAAAPVPAGVERWSPFGPPLGFLSGLTMDAEGNLFAAAAESGVYKSDDRGRTWFWSSAGTGTEHVQAITVDFDDQEIYAAGRSRFFRSTDAGRHWVPVGTLPPPASEASLLVLLPGEPDTLYLARDKRLYRSLDGGATWTLLETAAASILAVLVDPNDLLSIFLGTDRPGQLLHSADGGVTWAVADIGLPGGFAEGVQELAAVPTEPATLFAVSRSQLFRSRDAGVTWEIVEVPVPGSSAPGFTDSVAVVPGPQPRVYAFQQHLSGRSINALYASDDLGDTWTLVTTRTRGTRLRVNPATLELYAFALDGVGLTDNGGADWSFSPLGTLACGAHVSREPEMRLRFVHGISLAVVGGRLWASGAGGKHWTPLGRDLMADCLKIRDVTFGAGSLWAAVDNGVYRSRNGGATWTAVLGPFEPDVAFPFFSVVFAGPRTLLANGNGVWRSGDGGATWRRTLDATAIHDEFQEPEFVRFVYRLEADPKRPQFIYAGVVEIGSRHPVQFLPYVYQSEDNGRTWHRLAEGTDLLAIDPRRPATLYLATDEGLERSLDRGRRWRRISSFQIERQRFSNTDLKVDPFDPRILYVAQIDGVWRSMDGGVTWAPLPAGLHNLPAFEIFLDPRQAGHLFVASEGLFEGRFGVP